MLTNLLVAIVLQSSLVANVFPVPELKLISVVAKAVGGMSKDRIVDAATDSTGAVIALWSTGVVRMYRGGNIVHEWGGHGTMEGKFMNPVGLAVAPTGDIYVYDNALYSVSQFDSAGRFLARKTLPTPIDAFTSMQVVAGGRLIMSGYPGAGDRPEAIGQMYDFCPMLTCQPTVIGDVRVTQDSEATRFFQGGIITEDTDTVFLAELNPFRILRYQLGQPRATLLARSDFLPDGEPLGFKRLPDGRMRITNSYPQTTGFVRLANGHFIYTAFFPAKAVSVIMILDRDGSAITLAEVPSLIAVKGVLPGGNLLIQRTIDGQELAIYHLDAALH